MAKRLWQGAFVGAKSDVTAFNSSENVSLDHILIFYDIIGSIAHVKMLQKQKILSKDESEEILAALKNVLNDFEEGKFSLDQSLEDVHSNVENTVTKITPYGKKMHTARSRNDQINLDMRLYMRDSCLKICNSIFDLQKSFTSLKDGLMVGYTHTRVAQPITISFWSDAYVLALNRDLERLISALGRINRNPLGSCAISGTSWPIDQKYTSEILGFDSFEENALDATSARGEAEAEFCSALSILMIRLSGISEELIWLSQKDLVQIPDSFCTGSSIMPNKKNPDVLELIRARSARVQSNLFHILGVKKGLISGYHSDLQETKFAVISAINCTYECVSILSKLIGQIKFDEQKIEHELQSGYSQATEIADALCRKGLSFRDAHGIVGQLVFDCQKKGIFLTNSTPLDQFTPSEWKDITSLRRKRLIRQPRLDVALVKKVESLQFIVDSKFKSLINTSSV